jgi:hypothetical protein
VTAQIAAECLLGAWLVVHVVTALRGPYSGSGDLREVFEEVWGT